MSEARFVAYENTWGGFINDIGSRTVVGLIKDNLKKCNIYPRSGEILSWYEWTDWMFRNQKELSRFSNNIGVIIEYWIPHNRSRVDLILTGFDKDNKYRSVIIEIKGWVHNQVGVSQESGWVKMSVADTKEQFHPSIQSLKYKEFIIESYKNSLGLDNVVDSCVLMHNYEVINPSDIDCLQTDDFKDVVSKAPLFYNNDIDSFVSFITSKISRGYENAKGLNGWFKNLSPFYSNKLITSAKKISSSMETVLEEYNLGPEQKMILDFVRNKIHDREKGKTNVFIIKGDPGSGKTILAAYLATTLSSEQIRTTTILPGTDFRNSQKALFKAKNIDTSFAHLRGSIDSLKSIDTNHWDVVIIDESHKIRKSFSFGDMKFKDYFYIAKNIILFYDPNQIIDKLVEENKFTLNELKNDKSFNVFEGDPLTLSSQYRHGGDQNYVPWLKSILNFKKNSGEFIKKFKNNPLLDFQVKIVSDPNEFIKEYLEDCSRQDNDFRVRLLSTYHDNWIKEYSNNILSLIKKSSPISSYFKGSVVIGDHKFPWKTSWNDVEVMNNNRKKHCSNLSDDEYKKIWNEIRKKKESFTDFNVNNDYANGFVGYYNTIQGSEFDIVYVNVGEELKIIDGEFRMNRDWLESQKNNGKWFSRNFLKGFEKKSSDYAISKQNTEYLKNQIVVLLTRGRKKVVIHFKDKEMEDFFRKYFQEL